ncbi:hypothetical protein pEaSNUABM25_00136 [Erwinia phage pEa_SNUABM_25]|nr:hypothetical protein pEaSNUABM25_00136 [Erwinia phage pEa_SNUABM_25]
MAKPQEKELSALELMIEHADGLGSFVAGMPKGRKARKKGPDFSFNMHDDDLVDDEDEYYVGPGSRAKNRAVRERKAAREKERAININLSQDPSPRATVPNPKQVESALEDLFISGERSSDEIVDAIRDGTLVNQKTQKALEEWLAWEKSEAFRAKNKAKSDPYGQQNGEGGKSANDDGPPPADDGPGIDLDGPDRRRGRRRGRRYGRNRGERRGPGRDLPNRRRPLRERFPRLGKLGKWGSFAAVALTAAAGLGVGNWLKDKTDTDSVDDNASNEGAGKPDIVPAAVNPSVAQQDTTQADDSAAQTIAAKTPTAPSAVQDVAVAGTSALLMGASKRIPVIGPALGNGLSYANDVQHIDADQDMTDAEKAGAKKKAAGSAIGGTAGGSIGAVAGGWIGGILGSVVPVAGTAAGAALGATIGGILGDYFGSSVGEYVSDKITDTSDKMIADGEKDRQEKMDEYNDTTLENLDKSKTPAPVVVPFNLGALAGGMPGSGAGQYQGPFRAQPSRRMDSKQVTDIANKAIAEGGLGSVSEQFESGGRGVGTVSTGAGDAGGVSYGKHQLATNTGSMTNFLNSPEGKPFLARFGGLAPGTAQFNSVYKDVANTQGEEFDKAQGDYITRTHYAPLAAKVQNDVGVDLTKRGAGVKELMYSTAVQYGAGTSVIANALKGKDVNSMSDADMIKTIQDYKAATTDRYFKSSSAQTQQSVANRAQNEKDVLLKVSEADLNKSVKMPKLTDMSDEDRRIAEKFPELKKGTGKPEDYANTQVDANKNVPDLTGKGAVTPKQSQADYDRKMQDLVASGQGKDINSQELPAARKRVNDEQAGGLQPKEVQDQVSRIEPKQQPQPEVDHQPLVSVGDVARTEVPEPVAPPPAPTDTAKVTGAATPQQGPVPAQGRPGNAHSLDGIPVFMNDPMTNMITMDYM